MELNGTFWVENLPLVSGTNLVTLVAENAAGYLSSTDLSVAQSSVTVAIISTPEGGSLYEPDGLVYGTVSDPDCEVTVNGVAAMVDDYGYWWAEQVPLIGRGTATFDVVASAAGGGAPVAVSDSREMPARIEVVEHRSGKGSSRHYVGGNFNSSRRTKQYKAGLEAGPAGEWTHTFHGRVVDRTEWPGSWRQEVFEWTPAQRTTHGTDSTPYEWWSTYIAHDAFGEITGVPDKDVRVGGPPTIFIHHYYARSVRHEWTYPDGGTARAAVSARTEMKLYTGGKAEINRRSLIHIHAWAEQYGRPLDGPWLHTPATQIAPTKIQVLGEKLGSDGRLWLALPDNEDKYLNLQVPGVKHYGAWALPTRHRPYVTANTHNLDDEKPEFCVGQLVTFNLAFEPEVDYVDLIGQWKIPDRFVNESFQYSGTCVSYRKNADFLVNTNSTACWFVNGGEGSVSVGANLKFANAQYASIAAMGEITIVKPDIVGHGPTGIYAIEAFFTTNNGPDASCTLNVYTQVQPPRPFSGTLTYAQLVKRHTTYSAPDPLLGICWSKPPDTTGGAYWLDNSYPYPNVPASKDVSWNQGPAAQFWHRDTPGYGNFCNSISAGRWQMGGECLSYGVYSADRCLFESSRDSGSWTGRDKCFRTLRGFDTTT